MINGRGRIFTHMQRQPNESNIPIILLIIFQHCWKALKETCFYKPLKGSSLAENLQRFVLKLKLTKLYLNFTVLILDSINFAPTEQGKIYR